LQEANFQYDEAGENLIIDNDVNFRPGVGQSEIETYTPRTLIYDLKGCTQILLLILGGFGSLRKYNELYQPENATTEWYSFRGGLIQGRRSAKVH
jgi:protein misato